MVIVGWGGGVVPQPVNVEPIAVVAWVKVSPAIFMVRGPADRLMQDI